MTPFALFVQSLLQGSHHSARPQPCAVRCEWGGIQGVERRKPDEEGALVSIECTTTIWQEDQQYIAHAMPLDVVSAGNTLEQARQALAEAIELFLETAAAAGTLAEVLEEAGYQFGQGCWVSPNWVSIERHSIPVAI